MAMEKSTLHRLPPELRLKIFEFALEEFKSNKKRHPPTHLELSFDPNIKTRDRCRYRLQKRGLLAGVARNKELYDEALCAYYGQTTFKLTLRNWKLVDWEFEGVSTKTIQSIQHLQIQLFDGNIAPTEVASCLQSPWKVLSPYISPDLYQLLTSPKSRLSDASNLQTLEICAEGVLLASKMIDQTVSFFLQNCPKLQRVVATFPLHELEMQQLYTLRQMLDHFSHQSNSDDNNNNNRNFTMIVPDAK